MFCYLAVMGIVMEHEQKICQTELLNTRTIQTPKTPKCILLMNKTWKNHGKCLILTDLEQDKMVSFKQSTPPLATKLSVQHNFI